MTTIDEENRPNTRAMLKVKNEGVHKIWFTTNTSSKKVKEIRNNTKHGINIRTEIENWICGIDLGIIKK